MPGHKKQLKTQNTKTTNKAPKNQRKPHGKPPICSLGPAVFRGLPPQGQEIHVLKRPENVSDRVVLNNKNPLISKRQGNMLQHGEKSPYILKTFLCIYETFFKRIFRGVGVFPCFPFFLYFSGSLPFDFFPFLLRSSSSVRTLDRVLSSTWQFSNPLLRYCNPWSPLGFVALTSTKV